MMRRNAVLFARAGAFAVLSLVPSLASAQTLFSTRGLGAPLTPSDARSAALGGIGTGLSGLSLSLDNPADAAGLLRRGATATLSPSWTDAGIGGSSERIAGSRFPLIRVFYPANPRLVASLGFGSYLDQTWTVKFNTLEHVGTDTLVTSDVLSSTGGISQLRFGFSYLLRDNLAVGLAGGILSGSVDRSVVRSFADTTYDPFESHLRWSFRAPQFAAGLRFDPTPRTRVAASMTMAGKLKATAEDSAGQDRTYGSSMKLQVGASTMIAPAVMLTAGAEHDKYPEITSAAVVTPTGTTAGASTRTTWRYGGGLEYTGMRNSTRAFPLRLGMRYQQLPYAGALETAPKELAVTFGTGFDLTTDTGLPQALFDLSLERAKRTGLAGPAVAGGLEEKFWRMNFTVSLFGR